VVRGLTSTAARSASATTTTTSPSFVRNGCAIVVNLPLHVDQVGRAKVGALSYGKKSHSFNLQFSNPKLKSCDAGAALNQNSYAVLPACKMCGWKEWKRSAYANMKVQPGKTSWTESDQDSLRSSRSLLLTLHTQVTNFR
jgi:hypothetical protein